MIEGKTPEEIRETFHIPEDLTEVKEAHGLFCCACLKGFIKKMNSELPLKSSKSHLNKMRRLLKPYGKIHPLFMQRRIEEGEAQCALLDSESLCDGCFSSDSDTFLFGARTVYRDICLGEGGYVVCYEMVDIEKKLGFGRNSLIALAVLLGSDYSSGVRGIGPELACKIVKLLGESAVLHRLASEELSLLKKANCSKKRNQVRGFNNKENIPPHESNINAL